MKTFSPRPRDIQRRWYVVDADGVVLGRLASEVAQILRGKHKPMFAPHVDAGDHVIVVNAGGIRLTGGKENKKIAYHHSGYPGGLRETRYDRLLSERPVFVVEKAIKGMLPKNRLGRSMATKLQVYEGAEHPHAAQQPVALALGEVPPWDGLPPKEEAAPTPAPAVKTTAKKTTAKRASGRTSRRTPAASSTAKSPRSRASASKKAESGSGTASTRRRRAPRGKEA
jgi:large subunit ribosomal protein L13